MDDSTPPALTWTRRLAALGFIGGALAAWIVTLDHEPTAAMFMVVTLAMTAVATLIPHAAAQVLARGALWFHLGIGTLASVITRHWEPSVIGVCAGLALLCLGRAALSSPRARESFAPVALRRTLLLAMVVGVAASYSMALAGLEHLDGTLLRQGVFATVFAGASLLSVIGIARMRAWGVFLYLGTMLGALGMCASLALGGDAALDVLGAGWDVRSKVALWGFAAGALAIGAAPALLLRFGPSLRAPDSSRAGLGHQALVALTTAACAVGFFTQL